MLMQAIPSSNTGSKLIMAFSRWLLTCVLLYYIQNKGVTAQYTWNCSMPDEHGERYIPGVRDYPSDVLTSTTAGDVVNLYHVQNLNAECYINREVTAIEYCYRYNRGTSGDPVFNWTVLFFTENSMDFTITNVFTIESHPSSLTEGYCTDEEATECCDRTFIEGFELHRNNFIFGVTESAQGNTAGATLLAFYDDAAFNTQPEYVVDTLRVSKIGQNLSVGSTLPKPGGVLKRGLRMLWFVIDFDSELTTTSSELTTTSSPGDATSLATDPDTTGSPSSDESSIILLGSIVGGVILLPALVLIPLTLVCLARKHKRSRDSARAREMRIGMAQNVNALDIEIKANLSYIPVFHDQISTEKNVAYGEMVNQDSNGLYETVDPPMEDSTTQPTSHTEKNEVQEDNTEYDYVN